MEGGARKRKRACRSVRLTCLTPFVVAGLAVSNEFYCVELVQLGIGTSISISKIHILPFSATSFTAFVLVP